ncbi:ribbon-helix-helix domain-containing protein [Shewanella indica]|uniref:Ribbon-helix-helix domain-containing protein n=1 Tax=Shewanella indica TaxID=768528 RepID=A0ABU4QH11_9GAMM|nr:ribbon-helix-helix domain-containing protein [Shewanella indica]MDX6018606.1 ribbon-helix-helix domain-containing protein [Shewanella indica]MDX6018667.1 ribbon-helix-helix domain-containing protein [Shewanella indica]
MKSYLKDLHASLRRFSVRLPPEMLEAIDTECARRAGCVSRNTWIAEAIQEKLSRESSTNRLEGEGEGEKNGQLL